MLSRRLHEANEERSPTGVRCERTKTTPAYNKDQQGGEHKKSIRFSRCRRLRRLRRLPALSGGRKVRPTFSFTALTQRRQSDEDTCLKHTVPPPWSQLRLIGYGMDQYPPGIWDLYEGTASTHVSHRGGIVRLEALPGQCGWPGVVLSGSIAPRPSIAGQQAVLPVEGSAEVSLLALQAIDFLAEAHDVALQERAAGGGQRRHRYAVERQPDQAGEGAGQRQRSEQPEPIYGKAAHRRGHGRRCELPRRPAPRILRKAALEARINPAGAVERMAAEAR